MIESAPLLSLRNVSKSYGATQVLTDVGLSVNAGDVVCLIGPSGSGKSTLLRTINLLEPIDSGSIEFAGTEITAHGVNENAIRRRIGIVFQSFNLFPHMNVIDNITLAPIRVFGQSRSQATDTAMELLSQFGLESKAHSKPDQLSGGQQQRAAIVRALATEPELMLFDEVTSALDPELVGEVLNVIRNLKANGMTMLMATHEMGFAREIATKACFLDGGTIMEEGPPEQIFSQPTQPRTRQFLQRIIEAGRL
jgi:polar amino acid transport system ATP-binding protein